MEAKHIICPGNTLQDVCHPQFPSRLVCHTDHMDRGIFSIRDFDMKDPYIFRSYDHPKYDVKMNELTEGARRGIDYQLWEAARATSAAPTFFSPVNIDQSMFLDAALGFNNPSWEAYKEVKAIQAQSSRPQAKMCLVSIGSGASGSGSLGMRPLRRRSTPRLLGLLESAVNSMTETNRAVQKMRSLVDVEKEVAFFRFDPPGEDIQIDDYKKHHKIETKTQEWLQQPKVVSQIGDCAKQLILHWNSRR